MKYFLSTELRNKFSILLQKKMLLAFDLDGTLSPLVSDPLAARISDDTYRLLCELNNLNRQSRLAHTGHRLAIITGRSISDTRRIINDRSILIIGNHGLESPFFNQEIKARWKKRCREIKKKLQENLSLEDCFLEDKKYSLSIHFTNKKRVRAKLNLLGKVQREYLSLIQGLLSKEETVVLGKNVINILPAEGVTKGLVVTKLIAKYRLSGALFVGDDCTDETVFRLRNKNIIKIRVGRSLSSSANYYLRSQKEINRLLKFLSSVNL
ncbi:MAG: trehalose-phosphatase [Oligoflexia bacterium]|nr:trehalose-phosphatase [Oligoflexia bacterium]